MATRWMLPSWLNVAMFIVRRPPRKSSISASLILIRSRRLGMAPDRTRARSLSGCPPLRRASRQRRAESERVDGLEQLGRDRAVDVFERVGDGQHTRGSRDAVHKIQGDEFVVEFPRLADDV